jgi:nitrogen regulatory protein PII
MTNIKRIEVVINSLDKQQLIDILKKHRISGFTYVDDVKGIGDRGIQDGKGLSSAFTNNYFLIACSDEAFDTIKEPLRSLLKKIGGVCLVSDAEWLIH